MALKAGRVDGASMDKLNKIEKQFAAAHTLPGDMKAADFNGPEMWPMLRGSMKRIAYHEAGHFAARLFTQLEVSHTLEISILGNDKAAGYERSERNCAEFNLESYPPPLQRSNGYMLLLQKLAGYGAETILYQSDEGESLFDYYENSYGPDDAYSEEGTDFFRALRIAKIMEKPFMPVNRIIKLADKWTLEMLRIPYVWNVVETVAARLIVKGIIKTDACRKLSEMSCDANFTDIYNLPNWRRRLLPRGERELDKYIERA